jgi:hypothetical protein
MARSGNGEWRHLFVQQRAFERASSKGAKTFAELADALQPALVTAGTG